MTLYDFLFYLVSAIILVSASAAVFSARVRTAFISNLLALFTATVIYFLLNSNYAALLHLFIFTIAISVVMLFAVLNSGQFQIEEHPKGRAAAIVTASVFMALAAGNLISTRWKELPQDPNTLPALEITRLIQTDYLLPLFLIAVLILLVIAGNTYISRRTDQA